MHSFVCIQIYVGHEVSTRRLDCRNLDWWRYAVNSENLPEKVVIVRLGLSINTKKVKLVITEKISHAINQVVSGGRDKKRNRTQASFCGRLNNNESGGRTTRQHGQDSQTHTVQQVKDVGPYQRQTSLKRMWEETLAARVTKLRTDCLATKEVYNIK